MTLRTGSAPRIPRTFSATGDAIGAYRANTKTMSPSSQRYTCACCGESRAILGRRLIGVDGNLKFYKSEFCIKRDENETEI